MCFIFCVHTGLFCVHIGLFCVHTGLFCVHIGFLGVKYCVWCMCVWYVFHLLSADPAHALRSDTATHCNTLQHTATHCNTLQHTTTICNALQHSAHGLRSDTATHCNTLQHTATHYNNVQHTARPCTWTPDVNRAKFDLFDVCFNNPRCSSTGECLAARKQTVCLTTDTDSNIAHNVCRHKPVWPPDWRFSFLFTFLFIFLFIFLFTIVCSFHYGVATISRLLRIIGLFCKRAL